RAYVGGLTIGNAPSIPELRELAPRLLSIAAVTWKSESTILVAGAHPGTDKAALYQASADGAIAVADSPGEAALTDVIAFPDRTGGPSGAAEIIAQTANAVFYVFSTTTRPTNPRNLDRPFY